MGCDSSPLNANYVKFIYTDFFSLFLPSSETTVVIEAILELVLEGVVEGSGMVGEGPFLDLGEGVAVGSLLVDAGDVPGSNFGFFRAGSASGWDLAGCLTPLVGDPMPNQCKNKYFIKKILHWHYIS